MQLHCHEQVFLQTVHSLHILPSITRKATLSGPDHLYSIGISRNVALLTPELQNAKGTLLWNTNLTYPTFSLALEGSSMSMVFRRVSWRHFEEMIWLKSISDSIDVSRVESIWNSLLNYRKLFLHFSWVFTLPVVAFKDTFFYSKLTLTSSIISN